MEWLDDVHNKLNNGCGCEELTATTAFGHCKLAQEVFVDPAEDISFYVHRDAVEYLQKFKQEGIVKTVILAGQNTTLGLHFQLQWLPSLD